MSHLYVVRDRKTGLYNQTGLAGTPDLQAAVVYSGRSRDGTRRLDHFRGRRAKYQVIPVKLVPLDQAYET